MSRVSQQRGIRPVSGRGVYVPWGGPDRGGLGVGCRLLDVMRGAVVAAADALSTASVRRGRFGHAGRVGRGWLAALSGRFPESACPIVVGGSPSASIAHRWSSSSSSWACEACGGAEVPLRDRAGASCLTSIGLPAGRGSGDRRCPGCETRRRRRERAGVEPAVWYDTLLCGWVVRLPCPGVPDGVLLPLEIRWFDAPWAEVYRAASDLVCAGDAFIANGDRSTVQREREADGSS